MSCALITVYKHLHREEISNNSLAASGIEIPGRKTEFFILKVNKNGNNLFQNTVNFLHFVYLFQDCLAFQFTSKI